jgi:hypothetical protein
MTEKYRFILFGTYPYDEHWRPLLVCMLFVALYVVSSHAELLELEAGADLDRHAFARSAC